jgi:hypothetical protein
MPFAGAWENWKAVGQGPPGRGFTIKRVLI